MPMYHNRETSTHRGASPGSNGIVQMRNWKKKGSQSGTSKAYTDYTTKHNTTNYPYKKHAFSMGSMDLAIVT
jgi:hypothetical protein